MIAKTFSLQDPFSGKPLRFRSGSERPDFGIWQDDMSGTQWPVALGIPYLRASRADLSEDVSHLIASGDNMEALARLLEDTDIFAPQKPAISDCRILAGKLLDGDASLSGREMMEALQFGPVADYFALRGSAPTFFSGIGLMKAGHADQRLVIEVACGAGHFLYWMQRNAINAIGIDTVFSKLCLASSFLGIASAQLICAEVGAGARLPLVPTKPATVFCHDAFYFFENKTEVLADFRRLASQDGSVLIGHAHLASADHGAVSGFPVQLDEYRGLAEGSAHFFDDRSLARVGALGGRPCRDILENSEAISFVEGPILNELPAGVWPAGEYLHQPLTLHWDTDKQTTRMEWPSPAFAAEYADADYLQTSEDPSLTLPALADASESPLHPGLCMPAPFFRLGCRPLRWGIVGGGWIAADYFAPAFEWLPHADLVALAEPNAERRAALQQVRPIRTYSDWASMFKAETLDAVYIATPNHTHAELIKAAADRDIRVLCEKPLATNLADLKIIQAASKAVPEQFQTAFDQRYHPAHGFIAQKIAAGALGTITQMRIHYACWVGNDWGKVSATDNWRIDRKRAGGGAGFDLLPHCIDLVTVLLKDSVEDDNLIYQHRVHPYAKEQKSVDDGALLSIRTSRGILVSVHVAYNCPEDQPRRRIEISGTQGCLEAVNTMGQDPGGQVCMQIDGKTTTTVFPDHPIRGPFVRQLDALSRVWLYDREPPFPFANDLAAAANLIRIDNQATASNTEISEL